MFFIQSPNNQRTAVIDSITNRRIYQSSTAAWGETPPCYTRRQRCRAKEVAFAPGGTRNGELVILHADLKPSFCIQKWYVV